MKALAKLPLVTSACAALILGAGINFAAFAQEADAGSGSESMEGMGGAKGLFFEQLKKPEQNINTGLRYWIELKRGSVVSSVTNKTQFKSGDSIRFHVKSNIDGYAYILLTEGSRNEQSVLFPDSRINEQNRVERGKEYSLPNDGFLTFDENPGLEKLTLLLSRAPIDAQAYLAKPASKTLVAMAPSGAKDLVPAKIYVSYGGATIQPPVPVIKDEPKAEPTVVKSSRAASGEKAAKKPVRAASSRPAAVEPVKSTAKVHRTPAVASAPVGHDDNTVTVVSKAATGVLHVDVALDHK